MTSRSTPLIKFMELTVPPGAVPPAIRFLILARNSRTATFAPPCNPQPEMLSSVKSIEPTCVSSSEHPPFDCYPPASAGIGAASAAPPYQFSLNNQAADANSVQGTVWETRSVFQAQARGCGKVVDPEGAPQGRCLWTRRAGQRPVSRSEIQQAIHQPFHAPAPSPAGGSRPCGH